MPLFKTTKGELIEAQGRLANLEKNNGELKSQVEKLTQELTAKDLELNTLKESKVDATAYQDLQTKFNVTVQELEKVKAEQKTAGAIAANIVAQTGTPPVALVQDQKVNDSNIQVNPDGSVRLKGTKMKVTSYPSNGHSAKVERQPATVEEIVAAEKR